MGAPSCNVQLIDATPYRLRYLLQAVGRGGGTVIIVNQNGNTPDLRGDARRAAHDDPEGRPLLTLLQQQVTTQAEARHVLGGEDLAATQHPHFANVLRGRCSITAINTSPANWCVDVDEGANAGIPASAGYVVVAIEVPAAVLQVLPEAILDIHLDHTTLDSQ